MNKEVKEILDVRLENIKEYSADELAIVEEVLEQFIEYPTKPGYKRQDIVYFLKRLYE